MNPTSTKAAQTVAAANALSGEKTFQSVTFAMTGDHIADAVSGIDAVLSQNAMDSGSKARVLSMLADIYLRNQQQLDEQAKSVKVFSSGATGAASFYGAQQATPAAANAPWYSSGLGNLFGGSTGGMP